MKKIILLFCTLIIFRVSVFAFEQKLSLDFGNINNNVNINNYNNFVLNKTPNEYFANMSPITLLELAYEFAEKGDLEDAAMILWPFIIEHFKDNDYQDSILRMIAVKEYQPTFRCFLIDLARFELSENNPKFAELQELLKLIPFEEDTAIYLKTLALSRINSHNTEIHYLLTKLMDETSEPEMMSSIITEMRKKNHPELDYWLTTILSTPLEYDDIIVCSAATNASKTDFILSYIPLIGNIAKITNSEKVYRSMIYSLGNFRHEVAVIEIIKISERFDYIGIRTALRNSQIAIENLIKINQKEENIIYGLQAIRLAELPFDVELIQEISNGTKNRELIMECQFTIDFLDRVKDSHNYKLLQKMRGN
jgi:tetratricopeptide (TPR) repeat protein